MIKNSSLIEDKIEKHFEKFQKCDRFKHSKSVVKMALTLNKIHNLGIDEEKIKLAGLLHDYAKAYPIDIQKKCLEEQINDKVIKQNINELEKAPLIWHGFIGPELIHYEFGIFDGEVDDAIFYHTTGKPNMNNLTKIIFLADYIEPTRKFKEAKIVREIAYHSLDDAVAICLEKTINHLNKNNQFIYPLTIETWNFYKNILIRRRKC